MTEEEVKNYLWKQFQTYMKGQTIGTDKKGNIDYYEWDVKRFI